MESGLEKIIKLQIKALQKKLDEHWENTKEEREKTHTNIIYLKHLRDKD